MRLRDRVIAQVVLEQEPEAPLVAMPTLPRDLGWILMRALEKDPARRYPTVAALVADIGRWQSHQPVQACPPSAAYRLRKFVRRHRVAVGMLAVLLTGVGVGAWGLLRGLERAREGEATARIGQAAAEHGAALSLEVMRVTVGMFQAIDDTEASRGMKVHELLDASVLDEQATAEPAVEGAVREMRGIIYARLSRFAEARRELERARELRQPIAPWTRPEQAVQAHEHELKLDAILGQVLVRVGERERGWTMLREALAAAQEGSHDTRIEILRRLTTLLLDENDNVELAERAQELAALAQRARNRRIALEARLHHANALLGLDRAADARTEAESVWRESRELHGPKHAQTCAALAAYVTSLHGVNDLDTAEPLYPELIELTRSVYGPEDAHTLTVLNNHCGLLSKRGKRNEAIASLREIVRIYDARGSDVTHDHLAAINNLGLLLNQTGQLTEAEPLLARVAELSRSRLSPLDPSGPIMRINHAVCLSAMKRWSEAEPILLAEYGTIEQLLPAGHADLGRLRRAIANCYESNGHAEQASAWRAK